MEDRYLFRGKRIDNGEWVQGNLVHSEDSEDGWETLIIPTVESNMFTKGGSKGDLGFENWHKVDKDTLCQCTGLKDKSGKLIWENDIVNGSVKRGAAFYKCLVLWNDCKARFEVRAMDCNFPMTLDECTDDISICGLDYEIIGNKFDNPELLEVQE